jgi:ferrochelatase
MGKTAVILFNLGGPDKAESVEPFLFNLFNDKAIIGAPQPIRWFIARLISSRRAPIAQEIYNQIGGRSPLLKNTEAQATALEQRLREKLPDDDIKCFISMRYWHPMSLDTASRVKAWNPEKVILLPLYPQYSTTTTGSSLLDWRQSAKKVGLLQKTAAVCCYPTNLGFIDAISDRLQSVLDEARDRNTLRVLFSAHGLPQKVVDKGDPYQWAVEKTAASVMKKIVGSTLDWRVSYQSRVGPLSWIKPYTEDEIVRAGEEEKSLIVVPIAFVSEHSETLVELDIEYRELAEKAGVTSYTRVRTVDCDPVFIDGLADIVVALDGNFMGVQGPSGRRLCPGVCRQCPIE